MPNTAVFFPAMLFLLYEVRSALLLRFDVQLACDLAIAGDLHSLGFKRFLLVLGSHRSLQRYVTVLRHDLDVVCIHRKRLVFHNGLSNLLRDVAVGTIIFLLIGGRLVLAAILLVDFGVVRRGRALLGRWVLRR